MAAVMGYTLWDGFRDTKLPADLAPQTTATVSDSIFSTYLVPFEVVSVLLLAVMIGAAYLAKGRRREEDAPRPSSPALSRQAREWS